jgi:phosphotransferase system HPr-like phosphotransfer protein
MTDVYHFTVIARAGLFLRPASRMFTRIKFQSPIELEHQHMNAAVAQGESQWYPV